MSLIPGVACTARSCGSAAVNLTAGHDDDAGGRLLTMGGLWPTVYLAYGKHESGESFISHNNPSAYSTYRLIQRISHR